MSIDRNENKNEVKKRRSVLGKALSVIGTTIMAEMGKAADEIVKINKHKRAQRKEKFEGIKENAKNRTDEFVKKAKDSFNEKVEDVKNYVNESENLQATIQGTKEIGSGLGKVALGVGRGVGKATAGAYRGTKNTVSSILNFGIRKTNEKFTAVKERYEELKEKRQKSREKNLTIKAIKNKIKENEDLICKIEDKWEETDKYRVELKKVEAELGNNIDSVNTYKDMAKRIESKSLLAKLYNGTFRPVSQKLYKSKSENVFDNYKKRAEILTNIKDCVEEVVNTSNYEEFIDKSNKPVLRICKEEDLETVFTREINDKEAEINMYENQIKVLKGEYIDADGIKALAVKYRMINKRDTVDVFVMLKLKEKLYKRIIKEYKGYTDDKSTERKAPLGLSFREKSSKFAIAQKSKVQQESVRKASSK